MGWPQLFLLSLHNDHKLPTMNRLTIFLLITLPLLFACTQKEQEVRVESVSINQSSVELEIGKTIQLNATVSPSTATRRDVTWSSSKSSVASVSSSGLVTAVSEGTTTITASADGKKGECAVTVFKGFVAVSEVKLGKTKVTLYVGEEETLTASVLPDNATDRTITWTSSDKSIASVESGKVKAVKKGEATITAKAGDKTAEAKIVVLAPVSGITLNKNRLDMIIGETETLTATITPADADPKEPITWTTSDETIATVDGGKVTAVKEGEATVTATSDGKSATCIVKVDYIHVSEISLDITEKTLYAGETLKLTATVSPENSTYKTVEWTSSDKSVAIVDAEGKVDAIGKGTTTITAKADGKEATCKMTVLAPVKGVSISKTALSLLVGESATLTATLIPTDATPREELTWSSSAPEVATVEGGVVKALTEGTATITATVEGFTAACVVSVSKPAYTAPALSEVKVTDKFKAWGGNSFLDIAWYDNFSQESKQFIYPHILVSYVASEWFRAENMEYIIMGEIPDEMNDYIDVGKGGGVQSFHADEGYVRIKNLAPYSMIKFCGGSWSDLLEYVDKKPDLLVLASCAADFLLGDTPEQLKSSPYYQALRNILDSDNVMVSVAVLNKATAVSLTLEENATNPFPNRNSSYASASVTSNKNNKYTVSGYNQNLKNIFWEDISSRLPVGFGKGNIVVPFIACSSKDGYEDSDTYSSYPTAAFSGTLGNFLSILLKTHPGVTLEGASTIMQENYFRAEKMKYKDDDGVVKEGGDWHFFKTDEFIASEILQKNAVDAAFSSSARNIDLPSSGGLCYIGPGIQFEVDGTAYEMTETNRSTLTSAVSAGKNIRWTFNRELAEKYATGTADITVRILDHAGELIPDIARIVGVGL